MDPDKLCMSCMQEKGDVSKCGNCGHIADSEPESPYHLPPGTILEGKYLVGKALGQGGFGITYLAWDLNLAIKLAIKEYFPMGLLARSHSKVDVQTISAEAKEQFSFGLDRFISEAKTLARFSDYPNIVTVRDFFRANGTAYMVMNYVEGVTLGNYLEQKGGSISFDQTVQIMMPVMDALKEVHKEGFLHRDVSPDNIYIDKVGRVNLIDFGAARQEMQQKSRNLSVIMKVGYSPEEQYRSRGEQGPWTDIYATAATMYRAITGLTPPESMDRLQEDILELPSSLGIDLNPQAEEALSKALAVRAKERYQTIEDFQVALLQKDEIKEEGTESTVSAIETRKETVSDREESGVSKESDKPAAVSEASKSVQDEKESLPTSQKPKIIAAAVVGGIILLSSIFWVGSLGGSETVIDDIEEPEETPEEVPDTAEPEGITEHEEITWEDGTYVGQLKNGIPYGEGTWVDYEGTEYVGGFKDGLFHGYGTLTWGEDSEWAGDMYEGEWKYDQFHGYGVWSTPGGSKYEGEFNEGLFHGQGKLTWGDDTEWAGDVYEGDFKDDYMHGYGTFYYADGVTYSGQFQYDLFHGEGVVTWPKGDRYEGSWVEGEREGKGTYTWPNGDKYVGEFKDSLFHGYGTYYYSDGAKYEGYWANDKEHGQGKFTDVDGTVYEGRWENGEFVD